MSKYVVFILLFGIFGATVGRLTSKRFEKRSYYFDDLDAFCTAFKNNLTFEKSDLKQIFQRFPYKSEEFYADCVDFCETFCYGGIKKSFFCKDDETVVSEFFSSLGRYDYDTQLSLLGSMGSKIKSKATACRDALQKNGALFVKLGFLFGLCMGVLLI